MKNIKVYSGDALDFYKDLRKSLNTGETKKNLLANEDIILEKFTDYKQKFDDNDLYSLNPHGFDGEVKTNLLKLYSSERKALIELKKTLTTNEFEQRINTCPNCTIDNVSSLDHFIPKEEFPEFSVNPINLIPCCTICNSKKKDKWKNDSSLLFINLYSHIIPLTQYLFVDITSKTEFEFRIENRTGIDSDLFEIIKSHYGQLGLLERFRENSDGVISELDILISSFKRLISDDIVLFKEISNHYSTKEAIDGINNWKIVLIKAMISSPVY
ncbi:HNH endonuclease signature motif containing protein [Psychroserpens ponticola]|uniref:HNH endonuclease signature motif containing protein n=1 Tax=Psychroserpens ponticola TaxID=2932268 RepID=A0ABY7RTX0_9FLAO|nr:HNH endonuclease signature motif containing protein [Psychroserpens ponticola]WCO00565.1 HNH endonuclease signature motif containing protein [Psychroserpens ponticola]